MELDKQVDEFIKQNPLARQMMLQLTEDPNTFFASNDSIPLIFEVNIACDILHLKEGRTKYVGEQFAPAEQVLSELKSLGFLQRWCAGCVSPHFYNFIGDKFDLETCGDKINNNPQFRKDLREYLKQI